MSRHCRSPDTTSLRGCNCCLVEEHAIGQLHPCTNQIGREDKREPSVFDGCILEPCYEAQAVNNSLPTRVLFPFEFTVPDTNIHEIPWPVLVCRGAAFEVDP